MRRFLVKDHNLSFPRLAPVLVLTLTLLSRSAAAQSKSPSGTYGFVVNAAQIDSAGETGGAFVGLMTLDGSGKVTGSATAKPRSTNPPDAQIIQTGFNGTYTSNPDGTGSMTLNFDVGFSTTLLMTITDGGQGIQFAGADCSPCGADVPLHAGQGGTLTGDLPMNLFLSGAKGAIPLSLSNVTKDVGGPTSIVYSAAGLTGSGDAVCPDGSTGTWNANVPVLTLVVNNRVGNFLVSAGGRVCGQLQVVNLSGLVFPNAAPGSMVLHAVSGAVFSGTARVAAGTSLNGSYGVQFNYSPFPFGTVGAVTFDGAGNLTGSSTNVGNTLSGPASNSFLGTYSINADGSGTIITKNAAGQAGPAFSFVITDGGSQLLLLRTDANPGFNVAWGTARLQ
jgi:hypothetical protein